MIVLQLDKYIIRYKVYHNSVKCLISFLEKKATKTFNL